MSTYENVHTITMPVQGDGRAWRAHAVTVNTSGRIALADTTDVVLGTVMMNADRSSTGAEVAVATIAGGGKHVGIAGGAVTVGQVLRPDAAGANSAGRLVGGSVGDISADGMGVGIALQAAANGEYFQFAAMPIYESG